MIKIQKGNVTLMVTNLDASIKFYTEIIGFTLKNRYGDHWADIEGPGISIGLHPTGKDIVKGDNMQIGLRVPDLDKAMSELLNKGITFKQNDDDQVRLVSFTDLDGNVMYFIQSQW